LSNRKRKPAQFQPGSMTVMEWCAHRRISRAMAYVLWQRGRGPRTHHVGAKRLISAEADADWLREREAEAANSAETA
jgi:hypothetical protein